MEATVGAGAETEKDAVADLPLTAAVMMADPAATPVTVADVALALATFATLPLDVDQVIVCPVIALPLPSTMVAFSVVVRPSRTVAVVDESRTAATVGAGAGVGVGVGVG